MAPGLRGRRTCLSLTASAIRCLTSGTRGQGTEIRKTGWGANRKCGEDGDPPGREVRKEKRAKRWSSCSLVIMLSPPAAAMSVPFPSLPAVCQSVGSESVVFWFRWCLCFFFFRLIFCCYIFFWKESKNKYGPFVIGCTCREHGL